MPAAADRDVGVTHINRAERNLSFVSFGFLESFVFGAPKHLQSKWNRAEHAGGEEHLAHAAPALSAQLTRQLQPNAGAEHAASTRNQRECWNRNSMSLH